MGLDGEPEGELIFEPGYYTREVSGGKPQGQAASLRTFGTGDRAQVVAQPVAQNQRGEVRQPDAMPALTGPGGKPGQGSPVVEVAPTITGEAHSASGGRPEDRLVQSPTITAAQENGPAGSGGKDDALLALNEQLTAPTVTSTARCTGGTSGDDLALAVSDAASRAGATPPMFEVDQVAPPESEGPVGFDSYNQNETGDHAHTVATSRPPLLADKPGRADGEKDVAGAITKGGVTGISEGDGRAPNLIANALDTMGGGVDDNDARGGHIVDLEELPEGDTFCWVDPMPDGFRYAACGDGVAAPCATWIGLRLRAVIEGRDPDEATADFRHGDYGERPYHPTTGFLPTGGSWKLGDTADLSPTVRVGSGLGIPSPPAVAMGFDQFDRMDTPREGSSPPIRAGNAGACVATGFDRDVRMDTPQEGSAPPLRGHPHAAGSALVGIEELTPGEDMGEAMRVYGTDGVAPRVPTHGGPIIEDRREDPPPTLATKQFGAEYRESDFAPTLGAHDAQHNAIPMVLPPTEQTGEEAEQEGTDAGSGTDAERTGGHELDEIPDEAMAEPDWGEAEIRSWGIGPEELGEEEAPRPKPKPRNAIFGDDD